MAAESFALHVVNFYADVRPELADEAILDKIGAASLRDFVRRFIVQDKAQQRQIGTQRHVDTSVPMWLRSVAEGPQSRPRKVSVEVAANGVAPGIPYRTWFKTRVDVVWEQGRWKLADLSSSVVGPDSGKVMSAQERREYLTGEGWREIKP
ncbi:hypothetical protein ASD11_02705 [Aeromicrobium sp. Root495]|uniref:hypothetical protein n=1 Tax=Aeromicrobium sp. Root495 TaxID=1736550 RepID=UPI0007010557|nr:hypothetical protein [Aeromicrobium sp. Root495]KQY58585.1 hypothetical protein ASD11_02705 [Aeromicrobium sp. Root495]